MAKYETNLNAATTRFWNSLYFQDNDVLSNLLSPDCHLTLKSSGTGCLGLNECLRILTEIQSRMSIFEQDKGKLRFTMKLNKIKRSARFLVTPIDSTLKFNLGFQLEWECGIVIAIRVIEDPSPGFLVIKKGISKSLSDVQNTLIRQQTGQSHHEWRTRTQMTVTAIVLPKDHLFSSPNEGPLESKTRYEYEPPSDLTEIHLINLSGSDTVDPSSGHSSPSPPSYIYPGQEILTHSDAPSLPSLIASKLKFSPHTEALLIPDRTELSCQELFYTASDFQLFAIDYGDEIKEIMAKRRVSPQQAIAIYHSIPFRRPSAGGAGTAGESARSGEGERLTEEKTSEAEVTIEEDGGQGAGETEGEEGDPQSSDPPAIPPVLVSSLKADIENERTERQRRETLSSDRLQQQKKGWYPGKFLGLIKETVTSGGSGSRGSDLNEESMSRPPSVASSSSAHKDSWYPGKFLGKLRGTSSSQRRLQYDPEGLLESDSPVKGSKNPSPPPPPPPVPEGFSDLMHTHASSGASPKFFLALTIIGCNNLKSPLKRVIPRPINSSVQVIVNDEAHSTDIISNHRHPRYPEETSTFMFAIPPQQATEGYIDFVVTHKGLIDHELIGMVRLPFVGISMQKDCHSPDYLLLPLTARAPNPAAIGKGFHSYSKETLGWGGAANALNPPLEGVVFHDSSGVDYNATEVPSLYLRVYKVNICQITSPNSEED